MSIEIDRESGRILLKTKNTLYAMQILHGKYPVHLYYGADCENADLSVRSPLRSFSPYYREYGENFFPDTAPCEFPFFGGGDFRACALKLRDLSTGCDTTGFTIVSATAIPGRRDIDGLPFARPDGSTETLELVLGDDVTGCVLKLYYTLFPECDLISRYFVLENSGSAAVRIEKCMMLALDLPDMNYDMLSFTGGHCCERSLRRSALIYGNQSIMSRRGASSHQFNPFFMLAEHEADEESGRAYGFNLVYSGDFLDEVETDQTGTTRVLAGLGSECFSMLVEPGESFSSPEAIMSFSDRGIGQVSRNMHRFIRNHILPPEPFERRTVVLNSWEAFYFNIDENVMTEFADEAAKYGMDTVVMDDGWFGKRVNSQAGLGDWYENPDRFPDGLSAFVKRVRAKGIRFGIWVEPEMVNPDSELYRAHPEWCLAAPGREPLLSRSQLVLDMANPEVISYLCRSFEAVFGDVEIDYLKWDMNRHLCGVYSPAVPANRQSEVSYRYMLGVYRLFGWFNSRFPHMMIENCSGGGGRFDPGMMYYSTQIWTSDNTNPVARTFIQHGSSFGYPACVMSCHVANHGNACENPRLLDFMFRTAMNGALGYELNILSVSDTVKETIRRQIAEYREYEKLILEGDFYRLLDPAKGGRYAYCFVSEDSSQLLLTYLQDDDDNMRAPLTVCLSRADENADYTDTISGRCYSGRELKNGLTIIPDEKGQYALMFRFVKR